MNRKNIAFSLIFSGSIIAVYNDAQATKYIYQDAEALTCGTNIPSNVFSPYDSKAIGHVVCGGAPQGNKYFEWTTINGTHSMGNSTYASPNPTPNLLGKTIYLGVFVNFTRINQVDVWVGDSNNDTGDKGTELIGNGIRWDIGQGYGTWGGTKAQLHKWTAWQSNPTYHLNPSIEYYDAIPNNQSNYGMNNSVQLDYDSWHAIVHKISLSNTNTGSVTLWIDGVKISEYNNIKTAANSNPNIEYIGLGGTMCQPRYNCPPHHRRYDAILLTDSWQDIVDGGYIYTPTFSPPPVNGRLAAPSNLRIQ